MYSVLPLTLLYAALVSERMSTQYMKAVYEFSTSQPGEIPLLPGDVVLIQGQVDENWLTGTLLRQVLIGTYAYIYIANS